MSGDSLMVSGQATIGIDAEDIEIGAVELKNADTDDRAKIAATAVIAEGDIAVAVQAPVLGATDDVSIDVDAGGTISGKLRGLLKSILTYLPVLGTSSGGSSETSIAGWLQTIIDWVTTLGVSTDPKVVTDLDGTIQQYLRGLVDIFDTRTMAPTMTHIVDSGGAYVPNMATDIDPVGLDSSKTRSAYIEIVVDQDDHGGGAGDAVGVWTVETAGAVGVYDSLTLDDGTTSIPVEAGVTFTRQIEIPTLAAPLIKVHYVATSGDAIADVYISLK